MRDWLLQYVAPLAVWLRSKWILQIVLFVTAIGLPLAAWVPRNADGSAQLWVIITGVALAVLAASAVLLDKLADTKVESDKEQVERDLEDRADDILRAAEEVARNAVSDLNSVIETAHEVAFLQGAARTTQLRALRKAVVQAAVSAVGPGSRATYYTLTGYRPERSLIDPLHAVGYGRDDRPYRPFVEREAPDLKIWDALERSDTECGVMVRDVDDLPGLDWSRKSYDAFVNVPVKARGLPYGLLSVNTADPVAIGEPQRAVIIAMARTLALVEAMAMGPQVATEAEIRLSEVPDTLRGIEMLEHETERRAQDGEDS